MSKINAAITAVGAYVPDFILSNKMLEGMIDTQDEWIFERTGIRERRILKGDGMGVSEMGIKAVSDLCVRRGIAFDEIDAIICATVTPDMIFPSTANIIADKLGIKNAFGFDISAACSGFLYALTTASKFIESGSHKKIVVVGLDKMSSIIDYQDRNTCIIFGDAAAAVLLEPFHENVGILDSILKSDGIGRNYLYQKAGGSCYPPTEETVANREHFVSQDGKTVFKYAVKHMAEVCIEIMQKNNLSADDVDWLVPHQANKRIISVTAQTAGIPMEKVMLNIEKYGNTTAATIPLCLYEWQDRLKKGDQLILTSFGGGFTWGAVYLRWAY